MRETVALWKKSVFDTGIIDAGIRNKLVNISKISYNIFNGIFLLTAFGLDIKLWEKVKIWIIGKKYVLGMHW